MNRCSRVLAFLLFLAPAIAFAQPAMVIVVRHAEKSSQTDADPLLSEAGTVRAHALAEALADAHVGSVIVTQLQRTRLTAADVITAGKLTPIVVPTTSASHIADVVAAIRARPAGEVVLVVGHSNTVTAIVNALGGPKLPNLCDSQYGQMFILEMTAPSPRLVRTHYGAADPADPACAGMMK